MRRQGVLAGFLLLLAGCATAPGAFYRDPMGFIHSCARPDYASGYGIILPLAAGNAIADGFKYADCKTQAEEAGYVRIPPPAAREVEAANDPLRAPAWCQGPRSTWNRYGCSTR